MRRRRPSGERRYETRSWVDCTDLFHQLSERPSTRAQQLLKRGRDQALNGGAPQRERGGLGGDPLAGVRVGHSTADEAGELDLRIAGDEPDLVAPSGVAGL